MSPSETGLFLWYSAPFVSTLAQQKFTMNDQEIISVHPHSNAPQYRLRAWILGHPLRTADAPHQTIGKAVGLTVFASDALSSVAYASQEILVVLSFAGLAAFHLALPISLAIVILLGIVTISYLQTIYAYPGGGGAYIVARDNLGELPAQVAGAALLTDYVLTVAVSVSAGVAQIVSAYPTIYPNRVWLAVVLILLVMVINLRGVRESGAVFAVPTYLFLFFMLLLLGVGFGRLFTASLGTVVSPPEVGFLETTGAIGLFLILRAFSSGTTALTGVEAISNGITAFKEPSSRNAATTLLIMSTILGSLFLGITFLALQVGAMPSEAETVISQLARTVFAGRGALYLATMMGTTLILIMAANTAFADFPRLSALQAADGFLPRQLTFKGSRLVYSRGIVLLFLIASILVVIFRASVTALIPLYAVGVFLSFTLSQVGMARRWWKIGRLKPKTTTGADQYTSSTPSKKRQKLSLQYDPAWFPKMVVNGFGATCTFIVMLVFGITKFLAGAWIVLILIPLLVSIFYAIHHHYRDLAQRLSLDRYAGSQPISHHKVLLPLSGVHRGSLMALRYAQSISNDVTAVHVSIDKHELRKLKRKWQRWGGGVELEIIESPYRELLPPLVSYIRRQAAQCSPGQVISVVVPEFVPHTWWHHLLHMQSATFLRMALLFTPNLVIIEVPYQVD